MAAKTGQSKNGSMIVIHSSHNVKGIVLTSVFSCNNFKKINNRYKRTFQTLCLSRQLILKLNKQNQIIYTT